MGILSCPPQGTKPSLNESPSEKEGKCPGIYHEDGLGFFPQ